MGGKKVLVPNVKQQDLDQVEKMVSAVGLKPGNISGIEGNPPPGSYVISQSPDVGQQVQANSAVDLVVQVPVTLPDFQNTSVTDAVNVLQGLGLKGYGTPATWMYWIRSRLLHQRDLVVSNVAAGNKPGS